MQGTHLGDEVSARLAAARALALEGKHDAAREALQLALARVGPRYDALALLGFVEMRRDDRAAAERHLRQALELEPEGIEALTNLCELLVGSGRHGEAAPLLETGRRVAPWNGELTILEARSLAARGEVGAARELVLDVLASQPPRYVALLAVRLLLELRAFGDVATLAAHALDGRDDHPLWFELLGTSLAATGNQAHAAEVFRRADERYPERIFGLLGLARLLLKAERFGEARDVVQEALSRVPEDAEALHLHWEVLAALRSWDELAEATAASVFQHPVNIVAIGAHLGALRKRGKHSEAAQVEARLRAHLYGAELDAALGVGEAPAR